MPECAEYSRSLIPSMALPALIKAMILLVI
jgi:hypothetical protein